MLLDIDYKLANMFVRLEGELDLKVADYLRGMLDEAYQQAKAKNIIFNMARVTFIDSSGLGILLGRYKKVTLEGGKVFLVSPQPQVKKILELSGLLGIMQQYGSEEEVLDILSKEVGDVGKVY